MALLRRNKKNRTQWATHKHGTGKAGVQPDQPAVPFSGGSTVTGASTNGKSVSDGAAPPSSTGGAAPAANTKYPTLPGFESDTVTGVNKDQAGTIVSTDFKTPGGVGFTVPGAPITSAQNMGNGEWQEPVQASGKMIDEPNPGDTIAPDLTGNGLAFDVTQHAWYKTANGHDGYSYKLGVGYIYDTTGQHGPAMPAGGDTNNGTMSTAGAPGQSGASTTGTTSSNWKPGGPTDTIANLTPPGETFVPTDPTKPDQNFQLPDSLPTGQKVLGVTKDQAGTITGTIIETQGGIKYAVGGAPITSVKDMGNGEWETPAGSMGNGSIPGAEGIIDKPNVGDVIASDAGAGGMSFDVTQRQWVPDDSFTLGYKDGTGNVVAGVNNNSPSPSGSASSPASPPSTSNAGSTSSSASSIADAQNIENSDKKLSGATSASSIADAQNIENKGKQLSGQPTVGPTTSHFPGFGADTITGTTKDQAGTVVSTEFKTPGGINFSMPGAPISSPQNMGNGEWQEPVQTSGQVADSAKAGDVIAPGGAGMDFDVTTHTWVPSSNVTTTYVPGTGNVANPSSSKSK